MKVRGPSRTIHLEWLLLGFFLTSNPAALIAQPVITNSPTSQKVVAGANTTLLVGADGTQPLIYQWQLNGAALSGATNSTLTFTNVQLFQAGNYQVVITNSTGAVTSAVATLTVSYELDFIWARQAGGDEAWGMAADAAGNVYIAGKMYGTAIFGTNTLVSAGSYDIFLAKYARDGDLAWVRQAGNVSSDVAMAVAVDNDGNVFVTGLFGSNVWFDSILVTNRNPSRWDIFLAKYDGDGNVLWARNAGGGAEYDEPRSIAVQTNGDPIVTGYFTGAGYFDGTTFVGYGKEEYFAAQYSRNNGNLVWVSLGSSRGGTGSNAGYDLGEAIAVDDAGRCYVGGHYSGTNFNFFNGFSISTTYGVYLPFVASYSPSGTMQWAQLHTNVPFIQGMTGAGTNGFYICGSSFAVARVDSAGNTIWSTRAGGDAWNASASSVETDNYGNLLVAGEFHGTNLSFPEVTFTNGILTNRCVVASYDSNGAFRWARQFGGQGDVRESAIDSTDSVYVAGSFQGQASFGANTLTSSGSREIFVARLGVLPPVILKLPSSQTVFAGRSNMFNVTAAGERPLDYQWRFNGTNLPGATNSSLLVADAQLTNVGLYAVVVSNAFGTAISPAAVLTVITGAPAILIQPQSKTVLGGTTNGFFVVATNSLPFAYQWKHTGTNLVGATASSLTLTNISAADRGGYTVEVTNNYGSVTSDVATLTVNVPATIVTQPTNQVAPAGTDVTFIVGTIGDGVLIYQWRRNSSPINGATDSMLVLTNVQLAQQGNYSVVVSNIYGKATSSSASLVVNAPPTITTQPQDRTLPAGTNVSFNVSVSGSPTLRYQWRLNGTNLTSRTSSGLSLFNIQSTNAGEYSVTVTNAFGAITSSPAMLVVNTSAPVIRANPVNFATNAGAPLALAFNVSAAGSEPLAYQWQFTGTNLPGATATSLTITNVQFVDAGNYRAVVSNAYGATPSSNAMLTVNPGFLWARAFGGTNDDFATGIATDVAGNVYVAGYFSNLCAFGNDTLLSHGGADAVVAKYDPAGTLIWVRQAGGGGIDRATALAVTESGQVYLAGTFSGLAEFGTTNLSSVGASNIFLAKLDGDGDLLWVRPVVCTNTFRVKSLAIDVSGNCWLAGTFSTFVDFGGITLSGYTDAFLAKFDNMGNPVWGRRFGGGSLDEATSVRISPDGNSYVTGSFVGSATFGGTNLVSGGNEDMFLIKLNSAGDVVWAKRGGGLFTDMGNGLAVDAEGGVYVAGQYTRSASFDGVVLTNAFGITLFIARYTSEGSLLWIRQAGTNTATVATAVTVDPARNVYVTGNYGTNSAFGDGILAGTNDCFVTVYDSAGTLQWVRSAGGSGFDSGQSVALDQFGGLLVAGHFQTNVTFRIPSLALSNAGGFDGFLAKIAAFDTERAPVITTLPTSRDLVAGSNYTLFVGVRAGSASYQWRFNGVDIPGATRSTLFLAGDYYPIPGTYTVVVSNAFGSVTSAAASVTVEMKPEVLWALRQGGTGDDQGLAVAVDAATNVCVAGMFSGTVAFGTSNLVSSGGTDIFIAKYNSLGGLIWARRYGGTSADSAQSLAVDAAGNIFLTGYFSSTSTFGISNLVSSGGRDIFVAKHDSSGNLLWLRRAGNTLDDQGASVATDGAGNAYVTGWYYGSAMFGTFGLTNLNTINFFIAKYDSAGNVVWAKTTTGVNTCQGTGVAVDGVTNAYVTGHLLGNANFGSGSLVNVFGGSGTVFVAKYDRDGVLQWSRKGGTNGPGSGQAIAADVNGNVYGTSYKVGYGGGTMLSRYDGNGNLLWVRASSITCCTIEYITVNGLALDALGNPILAGGMVGFGTLEGLALSNEGFIVKYRANDGTPFWVQKSGQIGYAAALDAKGNAYFAGRFSSAGLFGTSSNLVTSGGNDVFLVKFGLRPPTLTAGQTNSLVVAGFNSTLQSGATGTGPFAYQWQFNGTTIAGATRSSLTLSNFNFADAGRYSVVIQNAAGSVTAQVAALGFIPVLSVARAGNDVLLSWDGEFALQSATNITGPYVNLPPAASPFTNPFAPGEPQRFFRLRMGDPALTGVLLPNQCFSVGLTGSPGRIYTIQGSTNLVNWMPLQADASPFTLLDSNAVTLPQRFYRAVLAP